MWRVCLHEAGHAVAALALPFGSVRHCIVGARTGAANRTRIKKDENDAPTRDMLERSAVMILAGRSAETVFLGTCSAGCEGDVASATTNIASLHMTYGLADGVIHLSPRDSVLESVRYDYLMRSRVEADLQRLQRRADELIRRHRDAVAAIAEALQARRYLAGDAVREIFEANKQPVLTGEELEATR
jgi:cell division protease FtsH